MRRCRRFGGLDDLKLYRRAAAIEDQNFHRCLGIEKTHATSALQQQFSVAYFSCVFESWPRVLPSLTIMLETGEIKGFPMGRLRLVLPLCQEPEVKQRKEEKRY